MRRNVRKTVELASALGAAFAPMCSDDIYVLFRYEERICSDAAYKLYETALGLELPLRALDTGDPRLVSEKPSDLDIEVLAEWGKFGRILSTCRDQGAEQARMAIISDD